MGHCWTGSHLADLCARHSSLDQTANTPCLSWLNITISLNLGIVLLRRLQRKLNRHVGSSSAVSLAKGFLTPRLPPDATIKAKIPSHPNLGSCLDQLNCMNLAIFKFLETMLLFPGASSMESNAGF